LRSTSIVLAKIAMTFFVISTAGPFALGYLMANGMGDTNWYNYSIYFYLHFQYNGFFLFGVLSLFFNLLERRKIIFNEAQAKKFGWILAGACLPTYLLSVLWAKPPIFVNILSGVSAVAQFVALYVLADLLIRNLASIRQGLSRSSVYFLSIALAAFVVKLLLQVLSALPDIAQMAYELRPVVIAYLHLVLIGVISLPLLVWFIEFRLMRDLSGPRVVWLFLFAFLGMELSLVLSPWWTSFFGPGFFSSAHVIFLFSLILSFSCLLLLVSTRGNKLTKIST
jgi:hypothetical protein